MKVSTVNRVFTAFVVLVVASVIIFITQMNSEEEIIELNSQIEIQKYQLDSLIEVNKKMEKILNEKKK